MSTNHHFVNDANKIAGKEPGASSYSAQMNTKVYPFILDHRLNHIAIVPASWYVDSALHIGVSAFGLPCRLTDIRYPKALLMDGDADYRINLDAVTENGKISCTFHVSDQPRATCSLEKINAPGGSPADIPTIQGRCGTKLTQAEFYANLAKNALNFGPLHQGVQSIYVGADEAIGSIKHLGQLEKERYFAHPAFLDIFSHVGLSLIEPVPQGELLVTVSQDAYELYAPIPDETWCHAKVNHRAAGEITLDVFIYSQEGKPIGKIVNYRLKAVSQYLVFPQLNEYYRFGWEVQSLPATTEPLSPIRSYLITTDDSVAKAFAPSFQVFSLADSNKCIQEISKDAAHAALFVNIAPQTDVFAGNVSLLDELVKLIQGLIGKDIIQLNRLVIITQRLPLSQASLPGFCQVANQELALYHVQHFEIDTLDPDTVLKELCVPPDEQRIRHHDGKRQVLRLLPIFASGNTQIDPAGAYLITGGLGGIGQAITQWLLAKGAKSVVLLNRSEPNAEQKALLEKLNQSETRVTTMKCDVTDVKNVQEVVSKIQSGPVPIKGIFHAAGINRDKIIAKLNREDVESVLKPKILGALALQSATKDIKLDHFMLFSSVTSFLGTSGVANYAAANSFLDAFAAETDAKAVLWGPWEQGMLTKLGKEVRAFWENQGFRILSNEEGTARLSNAMSLSFPQVAMMPVNWTSLFKEYATNTSISVLREVMNNLGFVPKEFSAKSTQYEVLKNSPEDERKDLLTDYILSMIQGLTGTDASDTSEPFSNFGLDSITTVEMTKRLQNSLLVRLPPTLLYNYTSIDALTDYLLAEKLKFDGEGADDA